MGSAVFNQALSTDAIAASFRQHGFAVVDGLLDGATAAALCDDIAAGAAQFSLVARTGVHPRRMLFETAPSPGKLAVLREQLGVAQKAGLVTALHELWEPQQEQGAIATVMRQLRAPATLAWVAQLTGVPVDTCQVSAVTRFRRGHYVDPHSDRVVKFGKRRRIAFVLFCSPDRQCGEGGNLVLLRNDGTTEISIAPRMNRLAMLDVERIHRHFVPAVTAYDGERLAIPGFYCVAPVGGIAIDVPPSGGGI
ncbi:hypothetical protein RugamoR64_52260 [Duganella rhizosphaerae]